MSSLVSIIIPSYNDTKYLVDAISSALSQSYKDIEVIVVNDGSTNEEDKRFFNEFSNPSVRVITKTNEGLAAARNTGIKASKGEFFVPLDADDQIKPDFIEKLIVVMKDNVGVAYSDQEFFGEENRLMPMKEFNFVDLLSQNHISVCSLVRREAYDEVLTKNLVGYNPNMVYGYEDWDFWISIAELGWEFRCIHEPLFMYRRRVDSMSSNTIKHHDYLIDQMIKNHPDSYAKYYKEVIIGLHKQVKVMNMANSSIQRDLRNNSWLFKRILKNFS